MPTCEAPSATDGCHLTSDDSHEIATEIFIFGATMGKIDIQRDKEAPREYYREDGA